MLETGGFPGNLGARGCFSHGIQLILTPHAEILRNGQDIAHEASADEKDGVLEAMDMGRRRGYILRTGWYDEHQCFCFDCQCSSIAGVCGSVCCCRRFIHHLVDSH